jgi:hypothetical protein
VIYLMMALLEREVLLAGFRRLDERAAWVFGVIASLPLHFVVPVLCYDLLSPVSIPDWLWSFGDLGIEWI